MLLNYREITTQMQQTTTVYFILNSIWAGNDWSGPAMIVPLQDLMSCNKFWSFAWTAIFHNDQSIHKTTKSRTDHRKTTSQPYH